MQLLRTTLFILLLILSATPWISPPVALALGLALGLTIGAPFPERRPQWTKLLLQGCVVGLGFGMNLAGLLEVGGRGLALAAGSVVGTLLLGGLLRRVLKAEEVTGDLVTVGTAICGGSAIAAVGPVLDADARQMSVALGVVFILNAVALFVFPLIGGALDLSQLEFGLWSAIAIHDTSSVVGAAAAYGREALDVATTVKLARALFIIPLVLIAARLYRGKEGSTSGRASVKIPWFIFLFILAVILRTLLGDPADLFTLTADVARRGLVVTLFLIGAGLSREQIRAVGPRPALLGVVLWVVVSTVSILVIEAVV